MLPKKIIALVACCLVAIAAGVGLTFVPKDSSNLVSLALYGVMVSAVAVGAIILDKHTCSSEADVHEPEPVPEVDERTRLLDSASPEPTDPTEQSEVNYSRDLESQPTPSATNSSQSSSQWSSRGRYTRADYPRAMNTSVEGNAICVRCGSRAVFSEIEENLPEREPRLLKSILSPPKKVGVHQKKPFQNKSGQDSGLEHQQQNLSFSKRNESSIAVPSQSEDEVDMPGADRATNARTASRSVKFPPTDQVKCITNREELRNLRLQPEERTQFATIYELCKECKSLPDADPASWFLSKQ